MKEQTLTRGNILHSLLKFAVPVLLALFLQAMYGAADLIIVGKFAGTSEQSGVATGSQLFNLVTMAVTGLSMGITVFVGKRHRRGRQGESRTRDRHGHLYFRRSGGDRHSADSGGQRVSFRGHARPRIRLFRDELLYQDLRDRYNFYCSV